jgi:hypothetical protein
MGTTPSRLNDDLHQKHFIYTVRLYGVQAIEAEENEQNNRNESPKFEKMTSKTIKKYLASGFSKDLEDRFQDVTNQRFRCKTLQIKSTFVEVQFSTGEWPNARKVYAEDIASLICTQIDWANQKGGWPANHSEWKKNDDLKLPELRLIEEKRWTVNVFARGKQNKKLFVYSYDGQAEGRAHEDLRFESEGSKKVVAKKVVKKELVGKKIVKKKSVV